MNSLQVPVFARLDEYASLWLVESSAASLLWRVASGIDMRMHVAEGANPAKIQTELVEAAGGKSIALMRCTGLMMKQQSSMGGTSTIQLRREIRTASMDPDVAGILLAIDSPGGTVAGQVDLANEVKAATRRKPVWAHIEDLGASAAYWLASQAERVTANAPTALIGSIGTYQVVYDYSGATEKEGVKTFVFATGPLKGIGIPGSKLSEEQQTHLQSLVDDMQQSFDADVQRGRQLSNKELAAVRHGGVVSAPKALEAKLIDAISPLSKVLSEFSQSLKASESTNGKKQRAERAETLESVTVTDKNNHVGLFPMLRRSLPMRNP